AAAASRDLQRPVVDRDSAGVELDLARARAQRRAARVEAERVLIGVLQGHARAAIVEGKTAGARDDALHVRAGAVRYPALVPEAADPERARCFAAFEFDPDAGADVGKHHHADILARIGHAGLTPAADDAAGQRAKHLRLDAHGGGVHLGHGAAVLAPERTAHAFHQVLQ